MTRLTKLIPDWLWGAIENLWTVFAIPAAIWVLFIILPHVCWSKTPGCLP